MFVPNENTFSKIVEGSSLVIEAKAYGQAEYISEDERNVKLTGRVVRILNDCELEGSALPFLKPGDVTA